MVRKFLALAAVAAIIFGCSSSDTVAADGDGHIASGVKKGTMIDPRDGQVYKTVKIGTQTWMAENLNYPTDNSYCYDNDPVNCQAYGRLYLWSAAMDSAGVLKNDGKGKGCGYGAECGVQGPVQGICPTGWHLPSKDEFETLLSNVGADGGERSNNLRSTGWGNGADRYGFSALPAGKYDSHYELFTYLGDHTIFWASTESNSNNACLLCMYDFDADVGYLGDKDLGSSVRCLQD